MSKALLLIDGDNLNESYTKTIYESAQTFGEVIEAHCFADFVKKKQSWQTAYTEYKIQLHYIPGTERQKKQPDPNTSDIALTVLAMERLYELPEIDACIIAANDKDYIPLAKAIREKFHKKAVMLYTEQNDKAVVAYDEVVLLSDNETLSVQSGGIAAQQAAEMPDFYQFEYGVKIANCIEERMKGKDCVLLSGFAQDIKNLGIEYGKSLGKYLEELFRKFQWLSDNYSLILGDKKDRIERVAK